MLGLVAAISLATFGAYVPARAAEPPVAAATAATRRVIVTGVPAGSPAVQQIIDGAYRQAVAANKGSAALSEAQWLGVLNAINAALGKAGMANAHAFLANEVAVFDVQPSGVVAVTSPAAPAAPAAPVTQETNVLPPVSGREADTAAEQRIAVSGFAVKGVGNHPKDGITPATIQKFADEQFAKLGGTAGQPDQLSFEQMQAVADAITARYRKAGFIVATAFLPAQTVGADQVVQIDVLEGTIGKIEVQGTKHYRPWVISASAEKLRGKPLRKSDIDTALLYDKDFPGVAVTSTFQPGAKTGQTDLIMVAHEKTPLAVTVGLNNYGTDITGRYRAEALLDWFNPLGLGDQLSVGANYGFDPHQNTYGSLDYSLPFARVPGLGGEIGADRSELQLNSGQFAALDVHGPTSRYFGGVNWKFVNQTDLAMTGSLQYIHEQSALRSIGFQLSDERFNVAQLGFSLQHTDRRFHGLDMASVALRQSLGDESDTPDLVAPNHARRFTALKFGYTRIQFLSPNQQLFFKFAGQYTNDALVPMEQFVIGGPDSVRAYPIAVALADRGFYSSLEYHVNAPGFANKASPFKGQSWGELLTLEAFADYARGYPVGPDRLNGGQDVTFSGAGVGLIFHLPRWHNLLFRLDVSTPLGAAKIQDEKDYQVYGRFDMTF
ncbi:MAG TPA: ShlB/FhaC/HecB family hemolysin secretion/activation protein [Rhodanobacteraceae bacterium]|nr:ShlB/FhaC/HecB family hemolysin secretion/activation protein [Rhodanobacteraceae bacterium]